MFEGVNVWVKEGVLVLVLVGVFVGGTAVEVGDAVEVKVWVGGTGEFVKVAVGVWVIV
jgi:hypothetical protein